MLGQVRLGQVRSGQVTVKLCGSRFGQARSVQIRLGYLSLTAKQVQVRSGQVRLFKLTLQPSNARKAVSRSRGGYSIQLEWLDGITILIHTLLNFENLISSAWTVKTHASTTLLMQELTSIFILSSPFTGKLWNSLPVSVFPPTYNLNSFKKGISRHLHD